MRTPEALETLVEYGIIEEVLRPLMSGKEAQIYLVVSGGERRVAKVYKEAQDRSFKQRAEYTEGRKSRNSRDARAIAKHSRHGKAQDEAAWRSAEVNAIYRLTSAGVRVPTPYHFVDGVLVMELVTDANGDPAPRLGDLQFDPAGARQVYDHLLVEVIRMLCAGVVHGDLSEFNVLMAADGPVVIDFPQAVDPASNQSARKLLLRDVDNLHHFLARFVRGGRPPPFAQEMWDLYQSNLLTPETVLRGRHVASQRPTNTADVLAIIGDAERDHRRKQAREAGPGPQQARGPRIETRGPQGAPEARGPRIETRGPQGGRIETRGPQGASEARGPRIETRGPQGGRIETRGPQGGPRNETRAPQPDRGPRDDARAQQDRGPRDDARAQQDRGPRVETRGPQDRGPRSETRESQQDRGPRVETRGPQDRGPQVVTRAAGPRGEGQSTPNETRAAPAPTGAGETSGNGAGDEAPRKRRRRRSGASSDDPAAGSGSRA